jgi:BNR repeat-like domain
VVRYMTSEDGSHWSEPRPVLGLAGAPVEGIFEQDPHLLPGGRMVAAVHERPGLQLHPWYSDDPLGVSGWTRGELPGLPHAAASSREIEPSWFSRADGAVVMVSRDQGNSFHKLASLSTDRGMHWSTPVATNMPDSRSKQSAGNLPDGTAFQVSNPSGTRDRFPLVITLSRDGFIFDEAYLLRGGGAGMQALRYPGRYKRPGFSYPKSVVWGDYLYVAYATNKEDVELTRIPLATLQRRN